MICRLKMERSSITHPEWSERTRGLGAGSKIQEQKITRVDERDFGVGIPPARQVA